MAGCRLYSPTRFWTCRIYAGIKGKLQSRSERLFTGRNDIENLKNSLLDLNYAIRKLNPKVKNAAQIRQSVSSTEHYQTSNLEDMKEALNKHYPLNKQ